MQQPNSKTIVFDAARLSNLHIDIDSAYKLKTINEYLEKNNSSFRLEDLRGNAHCYEKLKTFLANNHWIGIEGKKILPARDIAAALKIVSKAMFRCSSKDKVIDYHIDRPTHEGLVFELSKEAAVAAKEKSVTKAYLKSNADIKDVLKDTDIEKLCLADVFMTSLLTIREFPQSSRQAISILRDKNPQAKIVVSFDVGNAKFVEDYKDIVIEADAWTGPKLGAYEYVAWRREHEKKDGSLQVVMRGRDIEIVSGSRDEADIVHRLFHERTDMKINSSTMADAAVSGAVLFHMTGIYDGALADRLELLGHLGAAVHEIGQKGAALNERHIEPIRDALNQRENRAPSAQCLRMNYN